MLSEAFRGASMAFLRLSRDSPMSYLRESGCIDLMSRSAWGKLSPWAYSNEVLSAALGPSRSPAYPREANLIK